MTDKPILFSAPPRRAGKTFTGIEQNLDHFETAVRRVRAAYEECL